MATVSVATPSSTHTTPVATPMSRRLPLNSVPQAVNSPLRARTTPSTLAGKRQRQDAAVENATIDDEQPPSKKQHLNNTTGAPVPTPQTPVGQKIIVREKKGSVNRKVTKQKVAAEARPRGNGNDNETGRQEEEKNNMDEVKAWQRHYKRAFPTYVFFFENIPDEQGLRLIKQVKILGSRIERFFSSQVTHVITNRTIPPDFGKLGYSATQTKAATPLTAKKNGTKVYQDREEEKKPSDILYKAREYGMKIWALEKLQRMMDAMFDPNYVQQHPNTRSHVQTQTPAVAAATDLSAALKNERINGPLDRDPTAFQPKEMVQFKGPFILVRDLSEKFRPILVREYPSVKSKEEGIWPQFRSVGGGKCPFIEDTSLRRQQYVEEKKVAKEEAAKPARQATKPSATTTMQPPEAPRTRSKRAFAEISNESTRTNTASTTAAAKAGLAPPFEPVRRNTNPNEIAFTAKEAVNPQRHNREPAASGMQQSAITSAIRSNAISSHANPEGGPKAIQSRDMHGLQRKAAVASLEKAGKGLANTRAPSNLAAAAKEASVSTRAASTRRNTEEKLALAKKPSPAASQEVRYDPKPGYCENCKEKFDDFEEHSASRRHKKFAANQSNWTELDKLLALLPRNPIYSDWEESSESY